MFHVWELPLKLIFLQPRHTAIFFPFGPTTIPSLLSPFLKSAPMHSLSAEQFGCFITTTLSRFAAQRWCHMKVQALLRELLTLCEATARCDMELWCWYGPWSSTTDRSIGKASCFISFSLGLTKHLTTIRHLCLLLRFFMGISFPVHVTVLVVALSISEHV